MECLHISKFIGPMTIGDLSIVGCGAHYLRCLALYDDVLLLF